MRSFLQTTLVVRFLLLSGILAGGVSPLAAAELELPPAAKQKIDFIKHIQPLFRRSCYSCHGVDEQQSGFRVDVKDRAFKGGETGAAIIPGESAQSRLIHLLAGVDEDSGRMPPEGDGAPFTPQEVGLVRAWIDQGAKWPAEADLPLAERHWSFQPIVRPEPPPVKKTEWVRNEIDRYILARLESSNVAPSAEADRSMLIRRLYLDLLGLPPSPDEVREFLSDEEPKAYARLVDRVLTSKHYGERWGRHWLDLARYADSDGYEKDRPRPFAYRYRDWVIEAMNADMPFDQFTIAQIAGDMLPEADESLKVASGFHRNTLHNTEGGTDKEEDRAKKTVDRTNTVGAIWLGLTVGCAQCHSHKYDPITHHEYYSLYAFFNNIDEADVAIPTAEQAVAHKKALADFHAAHQKLTDQLAAYTREKLPAAQATWETQSAGQPAWRSMMVESVTSKHGAQFKQQDDGSYLPTGKNEQSDIYTVEANLDQPSLAALRLEALPDKSLPANGPGRAHNGNFTLTTFSAELQAPGEKPQPLKFTIARADYAQKSWDPALALNDSVTDGWAVGEQFGKPHTAVFELATPVEIPIGSQLKITLDCTYSGKPHNLGRFRLMATPSAGAPLNGLPEAVAAALKIAAKDRSKAQQKVVSDYYRSVDPQLKKLQAQVAQHQAKAPKLTNATAQTVAEKTMRQAYIHVRGNFLDHGEDVEAATPAWLPELATSDEKKDRLDLAQWLVSAENPLTARVTVNRIWQRYFGRGLVATSDDFGAQGEEPSHPLLLDYLATQLRDNGWSMKHIHRLIVNSATYRQTAAARPDLIDLDPENILLARQNRFRVEAEVIRDIALATSGLLSPKLGGPSVRPPQPAEYASLTYAGSAKWKTSQGEDRYRRGLYTFFQRTSPYPMLMTFDSPDSTVCTAQRATSNTPLQALTLWNDRVFFEAAQNLGRRIISQTPEKTLAAKIDYAYLLCFARYPSQIERQAVTDFHAEQLALLKQSDAVDKILGAEPIPPGAKKPETAAWVLISRTLMNLDEFVTKE